MPSAWPMTKNLFQLGPKGSDGSPILHVTLATLVIGQVAFIFHIAAAADWERAVRDGQYTMSTRGLTLGPLHDRGQFEADSAHFWP